MEYEQLDIFSYLQPERKIFKPGDWVEKNVVGKRLTFDEITQEIGKLIIMELSTVSHEWFKIVRVEKIVLVENGKQRRLVYFDGTRQNGLVNEMYFRDDSPFQSRAYRIAT